MRTQRESAWIQIWVRLSEDVEVCNTSSAVLTELPHYSVSTPPHQKITLLLPLRSGTHHGKIINSLFANSNHRCHMFYTSGPWKSIFGPSHLILQDEFVSTRPNVWHAILENEIWGKQFPAQSDVISTWNTINVPRCWVMHLPCMAAKISEILLIHLAILR